MWFFFTKNHPLIDHIHTLIDKFWIDQYGKIRGTTYKFFNIDLDHIPEFREGTLYDDHTFIMTVETSEYDGAVGLFERADKLIRKAQQQIIDDNTQDRINSDIEKYLASHSPLHEAFEDLKQIEYHKKEIIKLSEKWQDKIISLHKR